MSNDFEWVQDKETVEMAELIRKGLQKRNPGTRFIAHIGPSSITVYEEGLINPLSVNKLIVSGTTTISGEWLEANGFIEVRDRIAHIYGME